MLFRFFDKSAVKYARPATGARGFTLVEMVIVAAIIVVVTGVLLTNNNTFSGRILLGNLAYDVALSIREAQVYGIGTREAEGTFEAAYGVFISVPDDFGATSYTLFADKDGSKSYDAASDLVVQNFTVGNGFRIKDVCYLGAGGYSCEKGTLNIAFKRPQPDALIYHSSKLDVPLGGAEIVLQSPKGETRIVRVLQSGQISVE